MLSVDREAEIDMSKAETMLQASDGEPGRHEKDRTFSPAAIAHGVAQDASIVRPVTTDDDARPGPRSLLAGAATTNGRRSLFRR